MSVSIDIRGNVLWATMNRPRVRNAMNLDMVQKLEQALGQAEDDANIKVMVLAGTEGAFCAGSDLKELGALSLDDICKMEDRKARLLRRIDLLAKPVIASVQGPAIGGGAFLAAACDVVVAADNARIQAMEVPNGWITPWGIHVLLKRMTAKQAQGFCWGYKHMTAQESYRLGVIDELCTPEELDALTTTTAEQLAALPGNSVAATKRVIQGLQGFDAERLDADCNALFREHCLAPEAQETFRRFVKK